MEAGAAYPPCILPAGPTLWEDLPEVTLECVAAFLQPGEVLCFAQTCTTSLTAVSVARGGKVPPMEHRFLHLAVSGGQLEMVKWTPCPRDFRKCLLLAEEDGAVRAYLQMALDVLRICYHNPPMTVTETADAVALIDQGVDLHAKTSGGWTPLHSACDNGNTEVVNTLPMKDTDVHAKTSQGYTPMHYARQHGYYDISPRCCGRRVQSGRPRTLTQTTRHTGHAQ